MTVAEFFALTRSGGRQVVRLSTESPRGMLLDLGRLNITLPFLSLMGCHTWVRHGASGPPEWTAIYVANPIYLQSFLFTHHMDTWHSLISWLRAMRC